MTLLTHDAGVRDLCSVLRFALQISFHICHAAIRVRVARLLALVSSFKHLQAARDSNKTDCIFPGVCTLAVW